MTVENISWSISTKECCRPRRGLNPRPPGLQSDGASNWATKADRKNKYLKIWILFLARAMNYLSQDVNRNFLLVLREMGQAGQVGNGTFVFPQLWVKSTVQFRHDRQEDLHFPWNRQLSHSSQNLQHSAINISWCDRSTCIKLTNQLHHGSVHVCVLSHCTCICTQTMV